MVLHVYTIRKHKNNQSTLQKSISQTFFFISKFR